MKTATVRNLQPDRSENEGGLALVPDLPDGMPEWIDARSFDATQGAKVGSEPHDDATQGRKLVGDHYDDPTQGQKVGSDPFDDATRPLARAAFKWAGATERAGSCRRQLRAVARKLTAGGPPQRIFDR